MVDNKLYPFLLFDLNEATEPQLDRIVSDEFVLTILPLFHLDPNEIEKEGFKTALQESVTAYIYGALERSKYKSEKADNEALERATNKAQQLYDALLYLADHPFLEQKIVKEIKGSKTLYNEPNGKTLADMLSGDRNCFSHFRELLVDLQIGIEGAINKKPKPVIIEGFDGSNELRLDTDGELTSKTEAWRKISSERRLTADHALLQLLISLRIYWLSNSPHPYTEGMHHKEQGHTISNAVDIVEAVMKRLDPAVTRQKIVTALRKIDSLD